MKKRYYIAYGSNLNIPQMRMRCPNARIVGTSVIPDYQLLFKGSRTGSYLTIEKKKGSEVPVAIWEVTDEDTKALDRYEGYPTFYYKKPFSLNVKGLQGKPEGELECFAYIMHEERPLGIPTRHYIETCLEGYRSFSFDKKYLIEALKNSGRKSNEK